MQANQANYRAYLAQQCISYFRNRHAPDEMVRRNNRAILNSFFFYGKVHRLFVAGVQIPLDRRVRSGLQTNY